MKTLYKSNQQGFTLIELMIVIAIIGILMAYALPAYRDYTLRAKRSECNAVVDGLKTPMAEYKYKNGDWPSTSLEAGFASTPGTNISSISFADSGTVACSMNSSAGGNTITWTASLAAQASSVMWTCLDGIAAGTPGWDACP